MRILHPILFVAASLVSLVPHAIAAPATSLWHLHVTPELCYTLPCGFGHAAPVLPMGEAGPAIPLLNRNDAPAITAPHDILAAINTVENIGRCLLVEGHLENGTLDITALLGDCPAT